MEWFEEYFCTHQLHSYFTRQCDQLQLPLAKTTMYQDSFGINATLQVVNIWTWGARKTAGVARAQTLNFQVLVLTTGMILQDCTSSFVAHKKLENVSEENEKKLIHCPKKSLIFPDFQGPTHIFQVFQAWILKF